MKLSKELLQELRVEVGSKADLARRSTSSTRTDWLGAEAGSPRQVAEHDLAALVQELEAAHERLFAASTHALLVILQAMDAAGKDGTIRHVMSGVNPQGCRVVPFKQPSAEEAAHDFLWRYGRELPERGQIAIFNRSYYEEVLVVRVHPELLPAEAAAHPAHLWQRRFEDINAFEEHLGRSGTRIVKVFLHLSREEQRRRLLARLDDPDKRWKFSSADLRERALWDEYAAAYEEALTATSTEAAPWYVVPADHKHQLRALVGGLIVDAVDRMDLSRPEPGPERLAELARAREELARS